MGGIFTCICCYCCLKALKPRYIEVIELVCNIIEIGFLIWGIVDTPWKDIKKGGKAVYFIGCAFVVLIFAFLLVIMCLRCDNKINTSKNGIGKCLCITIIVLDILADILIIIAEIIILRNMNDKDDYYNYYDTNNKRYGRYKDREWASVILSATAEEICLFIHCYCATFLLRLINAKTNLSYNDYFESKKEKDIVGKTINIINPEPNNINSNQLTFIGYDKDGYPIYTGNQIYIQNQNITNPNETNVQIK